MSMIIDVETRGAVRVLHWRDAENRCNAASMNRWHEVLAELETIDGPLALVVVGEGKYFCNGLDLDRFTAHPEEAGPTVEGLHRLFGRLLLFPAYTVAAINGHAFAGGAMLTCACDLRVMRSDRGYWCLPEVDLGLPLTDGMKAVVTARLPRTAAADAMMTGRRYGAAEALARGIVEHTAPDAEVLDRAVALAAEIAPKNRTVIATHKRLLFGDAARVCGWPA
jgi:enoyl-CoA hydratase/carnithine racemase